MKPLLELLRPSVCALKSRSENNAVTSQFASAERSATSEAISLNTTYSPFNSPYNKPTSKAQGELKKNIAQKVGLNANSVFLTNGISQSVDLLMRLFCQPGVDNVASFLPTRNLYANLAALNDVEFRSVPAADNFLCRAADLLRIVNGRTKILFISSPNDPTGLPFPEAEMFNILQKFEGIVVVDESYVDFSSKPSFANWLKRFPQLVVLRSFATSYASAGVGVGFILANAELVEWLECLPLASIDCLASEYALKLLNRPFDVEKWIRNILDERPKVMNAMRQLPFVQSVLPTETNFLLVRFKNAEMIYSYLRERGIFVQNCSCEAGCENCLRITVGMPAQNTALLAALRQLRLS